MRHVCDCCGERASIDPGVMPAPHDCGGQWQLPEDANGITAPLTPIHAACERDGFYVVTEGTDHPVDVIAALIRALVTLDVEHRMTSTIKGPESAIPEEALGHEAHPFWSSGEARVVLDALTIALNALAPEGFIFTCEGEPTRLGFFR